MPARDDEWKTKQQRSESAASRVLVLRPREESPGSTERRGPDEAPPSDACVRPNPAPPLSAARTRERTHARARSSRFVPQGCIDALTASGDGFINVENNTENYMDAWDPATRATYFGLLNATMFSVGVDAIWLDGSEVRRTVGLRAPHVRRRPAARGGAARRRGSRS